MHIFGQTVVLLYVVFQENGYIYSQMVFTKDLTDKFRYEQEQILETNFCILGADPKWSVITLWKLFWIWIYGHFSARFCQRSLMFTCNSEYLHYYFKRGKIIELLLPLSLNSNYASLGVFNSMIVLSLDFNCNIYLIIIFFLG